MKATHTLLALLMCMSLFSTPLQASGETERDDFPNFIENKGQWEYRVLYKVEMFSASIFLEADRLTYLLMDDNDLADHHHRHHHPNEFTGEEPPVDAHAFNVQFIGSNPNALKRSSCDLETYRNYYIGNQPEKWASNVGLYRQIDYDGLYENIDFRLYGSEGNVKYDFLVAPNADVNQIKMFYEGADDAFIQDGNLHIVTSVNTLIEQAPYAYQYIDGQEVAVDCRFKLEGRYVTFEFPEGYDPTQELIIDPVVVFATYTGSTTDNWGFTATFDPEGFMYSAGAAFGGGYPVTMGAFQMSYAGGSGNLATDIGITKYTPDGSNLVFSTYIGGGFANEMPHSLIVSDNGELVLYGTTGSFNYPTTANAYDSSFGGGPSITINSIAFPNGSDIIVSRFSSDGASLIGSTFIGGSQQDGLNTVLNYNYADQARGEVILDAESNVYVASCTQSGNFPTTANALFPNYNGGAQDACVFKLNRDLSVLEWSTFLGGTNADAAYSLKLAGDNTLYVCGGTNSASYPATIGSYQPNYSGGTHDGFITQIGTDGQSFLASTFLGTSGYDQSYFVELDEEQNVYTVGQTDGNYPVQSAGFVNENGGHYIHKLTSDLSTTVFSTRFGRGDGDPDISPTAFLVDTCGQIYVAGWGGQTNNNAPVSFNSTTNGLTVSDDAHQANTDGSDFYLLVLAEDASDLNYATFFGGNGDNEHVDGGTSRFDKNGVVYEAVCASCGGSDNFPTTPGVWSNTNNSTNCNLGSFKFALTGPEVLFDIDPEIDCDNPLNVSFINNSVNASSFMWDFGDNNTSEETSPSHTYAEPGVYEVTLVAIGDDGCSITDTSAQITNVFDLPMIELVGEGTCLNDGSNNFSIDINFSGGSNTTYTLGGAASGTIGIGTTISLTLLGGEEYTITANDNESGCSGELTFTGPVCPDCEPSAGTMEPTDLQIVCSDGTVSATTVGAVVEEGQTLLYALHTSDTAAAGDILAVNETGSFTFPENGEYYTTYYISAIVGFADGDGNIPLDDNCTVIAVGSPVLFLAPVELMVDEFCDVPTGDFYVTAQVKGGYPEYDNSAVYTITGDFADELGFMETFTLIFPENGQNVYEINVTDDGFGCNPVLFTSEQFECFKNPIELLSFEGKATAKGNLLEWVTLSESNNAQFVVERSEDGKNFTAIGEVEAIGNSQQRVNYTYLDKTVGCGLHYYRLIQYDFNGLSSTSPTISIERGQGTNSKSISMSPIPSRDVLTVSFQSAASLADLTLFDTKGQVVLQQYLQSESCNKSIQLNVQSLAAGVYLLQINSGTASMVQRFVKY